MSNSDFPFSPPISAGDLVFERLDLSPAYAVVSQAIERDILSGRLAPGQQLPTEHGLARQFGVTRQTVREGIRILEEGGLVQRREGRRLFVSKPHHGELAPRISRALVMQRVTVRELWDVAMILEPGAAERAAIRITDDALNGLRANFEATEERFRDGDFASAARLDVEFHTLIAAAAANKALMLARETMALMFVPAMGKLFSHPLTMERSPKRLLEAHRHILGALEARDPAAAAKWMHKHIADFIRGYALCGLDIDAVVETVATKPRYTPERT
jgi:GntR family transcriptional repressor for pyruvate dehydrogenase complex